jgi:purine-binding chemotaxis protein CheW
MAQQLITFHLAGQILGLDIMAVREIRAWTPTTKLPHASEHVAGVVNLRGTVLPVMDLAARLGWNATEATERHVIIVTEIAGQLRGLIVDAVSDIVTAQNEDIQPPPNTGNETIVEYLSGIVASDDKMVMVLDLTGLTSELDVTEAA